jgi:hypothetical protein
MVNLEGCQIPCLQRIAEGSAEVGPQPFTKRLKRRLAKPWNYHVKRWLKRFLIFLLSLYSRLRFTGSPPSAPKSSSPSTRLIAGDIVRVRSKEEIEATLDRWKELKGCAFLEYMWQYCGTTQKVLQPVERFLDERDYQVKKSRGIVLLEGVICRGTPVFGRCDRCCHLFWREEWLEKVDGISS